MGECVVVVAAVVIRQRGQGGVAHSTAIKILFGPREPWHHGSLLLLLLLLYFGMAGRTIEQKPTNPHELLRIMPCLCVCVYEYAIYVCEFVSV